MDTFLEFLQTDKVIALISAVFIFFVTILLVSKRWINFPVTLLLLLFAIASGLVISNYHALQSYFHDYNQNGFKKEQEDQESFKTQLLQAVEDVKTEVSSEKENLRLLKGQVEEIFDLMDVQKQKLKSFIEETREHFKSEKTDPTPKPESNQQ